MKKLITTILLSVMIATSAHSLPIKLDISPDYFQHNLVNGQLFNMDVTIDNLIDSGVGSLGAFDLDVFFNTTYNSIGHDVLALRNVSFTNLLGTPPLDAVTGWSTSKDIATQASKLSMFDISLLPTSDLLTLPNSFNLATLTFQILDDRAIDILHFGKTILSTAYGMGVPRNQIETGFAIVVPEPGVAIIFSLIGLVALVRLRLSETAHNNPQTLDILNT